MLHSYACCSNQWTYALAFCRAIDISTTLNQQLNNVDMAILLLAVRDMARRALHTYLCCYQKRCFAVERLCLVNCSPTFDQQRHHVFVTALFART